MRYSYSLATATVAAAALLSACDQPPPTEQGGAAVRAGDEDLPTECAKCPHAAEHAGNPPVAIAGQHVPGAKAVPAERAPEPRVDIDVSGAAFRGDTGAPVTIVVFSDFECPFCKRGAARVEDLTKKYGRNVRVAFKHYPLPFHPKAPRAAAAAVAAQNQGRFWELHDRLFAQGAALDDDALIAHARAIGLDIERFKRDLEDPATQARVEADIAEAKKAGVQGTPTFFVNGERLVGAQPLDAFIPVVDRALARL